MSIIDNIYNIDNYSLFLYISIAIIILYFCTSVIEVTQGHLLALILSIIIIIIVIMYKNRDTNNYNIETEYKLKSLLVNEDPPKFFHLDADLIELFYNIKEDISVYNYNSYYNAVKAANNVLNIRNDLETKIHKGPTVPDIQKNFDIRSSEFITSYEPIDNENIEDTLENSYENFQVAEEQVILCMNHLSSLIISIPSNQVLNRKHQTVMKRVHILLKRNLDIIKDIHDKRRIIHSGTKFIKDYDLPKAYVKPKTSFEFY